VQGGPFWVSRSALWAVPAHPWVAPDESYLVFDKYAFTNGVQTSQLFASSRRKDGSWTDPVALGKDINATGTELIAKVSPDERFLLFQRKVDGNTDTCWVDASVIAEARRATGPARE
jgi:hypothetical protein